MTGDGVARTGFLRDSTLTLATRVAALVLSLFSNVVIARVLGPELKGSYSVAVLVISVGALFTVFGLPSAVVYFGARRREELPYQAGNAVVAAVVFGALGAALIMGATALPPVQSYLLDNGVNPAWLKLLAVLLPLFHLNAILPEVLRARGDLTRYNAVVLVHALTSAAIVAALLLVADMGLTGALAAWVGAETLAAGVGFAWVATKGRDSFAFDAVRFRRSLGFGLKLHWGNLAQFLNYRLDILIIGWLLGPIQVGLYSTATSVAERLWIVPHSIRTVLLQRVAEGSDDPAAVRMITARATRLTAALLGTACLVLALLSTVFMQVVFGSDYVPGATALALLMPGVVALSVGKLLSAHLTASGYPSTASWAALAALVVTVLLDLLLVPSMGIAGASIASSVSYTVSTAVIAVMFFRVTGLRLRDVTVPHRSDVDILVAAARRNLAGDAKARVL